MNQLGIGTYSFGMRSEMTLAEKLSAAAKMGYTGIEFLENDLKNNTVDELKTMLNDAGIQAVSAHCSLDAMSGLMPIVQALGGKMIVTPTMIFTNKEEAIDFAHRLEEKGREAVQYGLTVGYHNHTDEFYVEDGKFLEEYVIENTDPKYVSFQLDCGWAAAADIDCAAFIEKYLGRFCSVHVKENNRVLGASKPKKMEFGAMKFDADGKPIFTEEMKAMFAAMSQRETAQCPMGDASSRIDWKAIKALTDRQNNDCQWIVEREYDYCGDKQRCLAEDAAWLLKNL